MLVKSWTVAVLISQVIIDVVRLLLLTIALTVAGTDMLLALLQTDVPWSAAMFAVAYLAAGTYLLVVVGQALSRRWNR